MKKANKFLPNEGKGLTLSLNKITKDEVLTHKSSCYSILFLHGTSTELGKFLYLKFSHSGHKPCLGHTIKTKLTCLPFMFYHQHPWIRLKLRGSHDPVFSLNDIKQTRWLLHDIQTINIFYSL